MSEHNDLGVLGEDIASRHLAGKSYQVLERNWRCGRLEVDIIARENDQLVIVEVKTRSEGFLGSPDDLINKKKQKSLIRAANAYISRTGIDLEIRFDIVIVVFRSHRLYKVDHIEGAFSPGVRSR
jgi:putative endonuclease